MMNETKGGSGMEKCKERVSDGWRMNQCARYAKTESGYCKQHDPALRKAKWEAKEAEWDKERAVQKNHAAFHKAADDFLIAVAKMEFQFPTVVAKHICEKHNFNYVTGEFE